MTFKLRADRILWDSVTNTWKLDYVSMRRIKDLKETWWNKQDTVLTNGAHPKGNGGGAQYPGSHDHA